MKEFFKKFTSRKFLIALISVVSGIMTMANCDDSLIKLICSLLMIIVPTIAYIITEGVLDHTSIGLALQEIIETVSEYFESKENEETKTDTENEAELQEGTIEISEDGIAL